MINKNHAAVIARKSKLMNEPSFSIQAIAPDKIFSTGQRCHTHTQSNIEIIWVLEGSGIHIVNKEVHQILPNQISFIVPDQLHQFSPDPCTKGFILSFSYSFLSKEDSCGDMMYDLSVIKYLSTRPGIHPQTGKSEMNEIINLLLRESCYDHPLKTECLRRYLGIFLVYILREFEVNHADMFQRFGNALVKKFLVLLENNFKLKKSATDYADELAVTPNYLNEIVKKYCGDTVSHIIRLRIIEEAKRKAIFSNFTMKETAYYLGFDDLSHFSKFFKNISGINYSDFRKKYQPKLLIA
ncbi:MAG: helix-turn-helix transcriptional regulator [Bacteroidota bacterium]